MNGEREANEICGFCGGIADSDYCIEYHKLEAEDLRYIIELTKKELARKQTQ